MTFPCSNAILSSADVGPGLQGLVATGGRLNVARALAALLGTEEPAQPAQPSCEWEGYYSSYSATLRVSV